ncbi:Xanthine phosphoribosyltransferase [Acaryochloris thomasi RCC1774]|uniref:Xanthine phosphoribosyltransferase n=1 Tax=Acaryochloris thomasi RCC1774 TaxID=1764569 RepID=A0A2W1JQD1_9CYAN|nr:phosphoribosyltransferase family protein [Acaryochloris thomasi]PZD72344.1 Xanthine phosphoribosyltransferase [Acaryochloris thomasi RCC1774]
MTDLHVSWSEYHHKIEQLAATVYQSGWQFDQIICLARGGLRIGDILSRIYDCPLAVLAASSYHDQHRGALNIASTLTMATPKLGTKVLLVDDLVDSGQTLKQTLVWLQQHTDIDQVRTAVIWCKAASVIEPHYFVEHLADNPWIHQPFELYEQIKPQDLGEKFLDSLPPIAATENC